MNMFLHEWRAYRRSSLIWAFSMAALAVMYILIFNSLGQDIADFQKILGGLPEMVRKALNIYVEQISNLTGFYSIIYIYIVLCGAIQAMNLGTSIVSKEVREKTADFLLTKPVSRREILTAKLLAAIASLVVTNLIYWAIVILATLSVHSEFNMTTFLMITATIFFVQLIFLALGVLVSVMMGKIRSVLSVSLTTVFSFFTLSMLGSIIGEETARYLTPFRYFDTTYIIQNASYEFSYILVGTAFIITAIVISFLVYGKKDIHAV